MNIIRFLVILVIIISVIARVSDKKAQARKNAAKASPSRKPSAPPKNVSPAPEATLFSYASEGDDPCHSSMLTGFSEDDSFGSNSSLYETDLTDEGFGSSEGEDPCHESMLTGAPDSDAAPSPIIPGTNAGELLRGIVFSEVLGRPKAARR